MAIVLECDGDNTYKLPHAKIDQLARKGELPESLRCDSAVIKRARQFIASRQYHAYLISRYYVNPPRALTWKISYKKNTINSYRRFSMVSSANRIRSYCSDLLPSKLLPTHLRFTPPYSRIF
ncbi:TPA: hypothetical protein N0F65_000524 [Lagenidium giganteum]|uniref:Uncharacterized protein n=1 Tax=Lagenidium giganteum TaxID=4803 RepID=A0AAV2Z2R8_9STRA|nr:TPA: hypothetical protein N0F65_000524 [Lagenidium giganteum]